MFFPANSCHASPARLPSTAPASCPTTTSRRDGRAPDTFARSSHIPAGQWAAGALATVALALPAVAAGRPTTTTTAANDNAPAELFLGPILLGVAAGYSCGDARFGWKVGLFSLLALLGLAANEAWFKAYTRAAH